MNPKNKSITSLNNLSSRQIMEQDEDDGQSVSSCGIDLENMHPPTTPAAAAATNMNGRSQPTLLSMVHHKWRKILKRDSAEITPSDPSFKTIYLGNVVTTWAKGEGCLERPASALWKNHCQGRGSIKMLISVSIYKNINCLNIYFFTELLLEFDRELWVLIRRLLPV